MSDSTLERVARALTTARREHVAADDRLFADVLRTPDDAYAVQALVEHALGCTGADARRFWKSGGPSRTALQTHAALPPQGVHDAHGAAAADLAADFLERGIEAELALRIGERVDRERALGLDVEAATALVDAITVSVEIVESRWRQGADADALLRLADHQSHGALVLGQWQPFARRDWTAQTCRVSLGDAPAVQWQGTHSMADPCHVLPAWLRHATRDGQPVEPGTVVTTGTWCGLLAGQRGQSVRVTFDGIGEVALRFAD